MEVAATLKDALACLPALDGLSKPEVVVIFSYDAQGESLYVRPRDVSAINARILQEEENQDEDVYDPPRRVLLAPTIFVCDSAGTVNVQAFAAHSQIRVWSPHRTLYLPSAERNFRKSVMDPRPVIHLTVCYPSAVDQQEEFQTFSEFSGIKKELDPVWDEALKPLSEDWAGGKCSVSLPLLKQTLLPTIMKYDCQVINIWGGGNVTVLALVSVFHLNSLSSEFLFVKQPRIVSAACRYTPELVERSLVFQSLPSAMSTMIQLQIASAARRYNKNPISLTFGSISLPG